MALPPHVQLSLDLAAQAAQRNQDININKNNDVNVANNDLTLSGSAASIWDSIKGIGNGALDTIGKILGGGTPISDVPECKPGFGDLFKVGRPIAFHESVDPGHRIGNYLRNRMGLADILPCRFSIPFVDVINNAQSGSLTLKDLLPVLNYDTPINEFKKQCSHYGLPNRFMGLRIFSTDDSGASDSISNNYEASFLQQKADSFIDGTMGKVSKIFRSLGGAGDQALVNINDYVRDTALPAIGNVVGDVAGAAGSALGLGQDTMDVIGNIGKVASGVVGAVSDAVILGNRISLPEIWANSDYQPRFSITTKLISPYGHPKAVKEFIIKPFLMLLLMCSPKTNDGISYGRPWSVTVNSYGLASLPLACISSISFRRGGGESAYNIFKQPIVIDVTIEMVGLCRGFGMHTGIDGDTDDLNIFAQSDKPKDTLQFTGKTLFHTGGHIVDSLRPHTPDVEIKSQLGMKTWAKPGALGSSGSGNISLGSIGSVGSGGVSGGAIGGIIGSIKSIGGAISGTINSVTGIVNDVKGTVNNVYNAVNDVVSGITRPINDIVNAVNTEVKNVNSALGGLDRSIDDLSTTVVNNSAIRTVNGTLNNINNTIRTINNTSITANNLMRTIEGFPDNVKIDLINYLNNKLGNDWIKTGHNIDDIY